MAAEPLLGSVISERHAPLLLCLLGLSALPVVPVSALAVIPPHGLVSFWDFQEPSGAFVSKLGRGKYALDEKSFDPRTRVWSSNNEVRRVQDAPPTRPFGALSASIDASQMLHVADTYAAAPLLSKGAGPDPLDQRSLTIFSMLYRAS